MSNTKWTWYTEQTHSQRISNRIESRINEFIFDIKSPLLFVFPPYLYEWK